MEIAVAEFDSRGVAGVGGAKVNRELRKRAEAVLLMQECGVYTDSQTLYAAIHIAHHNQRFQEAGDYWQPHFRTLAEMMRQKFPECRCKKCANSKVSIRTAMKNIASLAS